MPVYCFAIQRDGSDVETLGALPLSDDAQSLAFAKGVINDMTSGGGTYDASWIMNITEGKRGVGRVPFAAAR